MATSADALIGSLLQQPGLIGQAFALAQQNADQHAQAQQQQVLGDQRIQANQQAFAAQAADQQQQQAFNGWWQDYASNPTPDKLRAGIAQFPQQAKAIQDQSAALDAPARQSRELQLGQLYNAAKNGRADLVGDQLNAVIAAEQKAGIDTKDAEQVRAAVASGDKDALKGVLAFTQAHLALSNPDFAKSLGIGDRENHYTQLGSGGLYDQRTGEIIRQPDDPGDKPEYRTVKNADGSESIVQLGGGDRASTGGGAVGGSGGPARTVGGWTPRKSAGGDNTDVAVDGKISGMAASLGLSPTAPFPAGMTNRQVFDALTLSEGGKGSLADRNNNPGNLTDPKTGAYRKFPTKEAGIAAGVAQVARNRARGQNTIQTMVEGRPVGGNAAAPASAGGPGKVVYTSKPGLPGGDLSEEEKTYYAQQLAGGGKMSDFGLTGKENTGLRRELLGKAADINIDRQLSGFQANLVRADLKANTHSLQQLAGIQTAISASEDTASRNADQVLKLAPANVGGSIPIFNRWVQAGRTNVKGDGGLARFSLAIDTLANEYAKVMTTASGTGGTTSDSARAEAHSLINRSQSLAQLRGTIQQMKIDMHNRQLALQAQRDVLSGRITSPANGTPATAPAAPSGIRILRVRPK